MASSTFVISLELSQLPLKINRTPEKNAIKALAPDRPDQPFDERVRNRDKRNRFDLINLEHPQVGEPPVKAKRRIVVSAEVFRWWLTRGRVIEHSANRNSINVWGLDTETDDPAAKDIHTRRTTSFSICMPKAREICRAMRKQPNMGLRRFISKIAAMSSGQGLWGRVYREGHRKRTGADIFGVPTLCGT